MSTTLLDIQAALDVGILAVLEPLIGSDNVVFEGMTYQPVQNRPYARVSHIPATTSPAGAGVDSHTRHPGISQVSIYTPPLRGSRQTLALAQALVDALKRGTNLTHGDTTVTVWSVSRGPSFPEAGWQHLPVTIRWLTYALD